MKAVLNGESETVEEFLDGLQAKLASNGNKNNVTARDELRASGVDSDGFALLLKFFRQHYERLHLQSLEFGQCHLSAASMTDLGKAIDECTLSTLRHLHLSHNGAKEAHFVALAPSLQRSKLISLDFSHNTIAGRDSALTMERLLSTNESLETLRLAHNKWLPRHMTAFAKGLKQNQTLRLLDVSENEIKDVGVNKLLQALDTRLFPCRLESLQLSQSGIREKGAKYVADFLFENRVLHSLNLSKNFIGAVGALEFRRALQCNHVLREVNLSHNNIQDEGAKAIASGLLQSQDSNLRCLHLSHNNLKDDATPLLAELLRARSILERLFLSGNSIGNQGMAQIADALHSNNGLVDLYLEQNKMTDATPFVKLIMKRDFNMRCLKLDRNPLPDEKEQAIRQAFMLGYNMNQWLGATMNRFDTTRSMTLRLLEEEGVRYGDNELVALAKRLRQSQCILSKAELSSRLVSDRGLSALIETNKVKWLFVSRTALLTPVGLHSLTRSTLLSLVSLTNCRLGPESARAFCLQQPPSLVSLSLESNCITDEGARALLSSQTLLCSLRSLNLASNNLTDSAVAGLTSLHSLETLHLNDNQFTDLGALDLAKAILTQNELGWLNMSRNRLSPRAVKVLHMYLRNELVLDSEDQRCD